VLGSARTDRRILHVDLEAFFVSVERALDPALRARPVVVGASSSSEGLVACASIEAREAGVRPGNSIASARRLCPSAAFLPGDLDTYARVTQEVTSLLLTASRRVERPSADEAFVDLTPDSRSPSAPVRTAERVREQLQRRLGLDASCGLASSRLAARIASRQARPRGLLLVLPGYEAAYLAHQPLSALPDLQPEAERALERLGLTSLGQLASADEAVLQKALGTAVARSIASTLRVECEPSIAVAAPPTRIAEEIAVREPRREVEGLVGMLDRLVARAFARLRPFGLGAGMLSVDVRTLDREEHRSETLEPELFDTATAQGVARRLTVPLLDPPLCVRALGLRLARLAPARAQASLFASLGDAAAVR
jgi:DNA polymerase IV